MISTMANVQETQTHMFNKLSDDMDGLRTDMRELLGASQAAPPPVYKPADSIKPGGWMYVEYMCNAFHELNHLGCATLRYP